MRNLWLTLVLVGVVSTAWAAPQEELQDVEVKRKLAEEHKTLLQAKSVSLQKELTELQKQLIALANQLQVNERTLTKRELELTEIKHRIDASEVDLEKKRIDLGHSLSAMIRLTRVPPEAWVAMPGDMGQGLRAGIALKHVTQDLRLRAEQLKQDLATLALLKQEADAARAALDAEKAQLLETRGTIEQSITKRKALQQELGSDLARNQKEILFLSERASSLQDLVQSLETQRKAQQQAGRRKADTKGPKFAEAKGGLQKPAEGKLVKSFGENDSGSPFRGIEMSTREQAQVVAPYDGEVVYAGPFRSYGNIVIIRHDSDYHTLVGGMKSITSGAGDKVLKGEPIGKMGREKDGLTKLYIELRKNAKPVDPSSWIAG